MNVFIQEAPTEENTVWECIRIVAAMQDCTIV